MLGLKKSVASVKSITSAVLLGFGSVAVASSSSPTSQDDYGAFLYGQAQSQGAGTPNQVSAGGFVPLYQDSDSLWYADVQLGLQLPDFSGYSSIINTDVSGGTLATSTRVGRRWLGDSDLWMFGLYAGYDTRQLKSGSLDEPNVTVTDRRTVNFQQIALGFEARHQRLKASGYALIPIGDKEQTLNSAYEAGALNTYGLDLGWAVAPKLTATLGTYYQYSNPESINGWGVSLGAQYAVVDGLLLGATYSNDSAFNSRVMVQLTYRFGAGQAGARTGSFDLATPLEHRSIRVHDASMAIQAMQYQRKILRDR